MELLEIIFWICIDGYVSGATAWDIDGDFIQDNETVETTTDSTGFYELNGVTAGVVR